MRTKTVYLDYAATTPVETEVVEAMIPLFHDRFGNPSSVHRYGQEAEAALEDARLRLAEDIGCQAENLVFTSGGSESDNLALRGTALARRQAMGADRVVIGPTEHPAVANAARHLARHHGFRVDTLPVDSHGRVDPDSVRRALGHKTALVSVIAANNEIGTLNPVDDIAPICREAGIPFHTDAVQAAAHLRLTPDPDAPELVSIGAHKFYGPKGVGALVCRGGVELVALQEGGSQERGRRAGTENVPLIVGMARAYRITVERLETYAARERQLRDALIAGVLHRIPGARLTGHPELRLPNHASFVFPGIDGNRLLAALDLGGFACSSGSACKTGDPQPSAVLLALGLDPELALSSLRVSVGRPTTEAEIESFLDFLPRAVASLRQTAPLPG